MTTTRMDLLRPLLDSYRRRFTVLDLGAGCGAEAKQIGKEYDAVVVAIEKDFGDTDGYDLESYRDLPRALCVKRNFSVDDLETLRSCEYFDVVLAFNVLHWFGEQDWIKATKTVASLGSHVFIQLPSLGDTKAPGAVFRQAQHELLGEPMGETVQLPQHAPRPLWHICNAIMQGHIGLCKLTKTHFWAHQGSADTVVFATPGALTYRNLRKKANGTWLPGVNLWNFIGLGGVYPSQERVLQLLREFKLPEQNHGDIVPWNFVFDGHELHLIDGYEGWEFHDEENIKGCIRAVEERYQELRCQD